MAFFDRFRRKKHEDKNKADEESKVEENDTGEETGEPGPDRLENAGGVPVKAMPDDDRSSKTSFAAVQIERLNEDEDDEDSNEEQRIEGKQGFFSRLKLGLTKTRKNIGDKITNLVKSNRKLDDEFWEELEEILIEADVGVNTSLELVKSVRDSARKQKMNDSSQVMTLIREEVRKMLESSGDLSLRSSEEKLTVILVVGVNGAGKTTSIAKMAHRFKNYDQKVILAAADTFRAAAIDQLQIWADRVGVELIKHQEGSDPGAVVYDAINAARARKADILIIDTAGRLQNKSNLMKEISKIRKVIEREIPGAPHEVLLVLDACTGQNAISQARIFEEATGVTGIILTKLDGTAKGGIVLAIARELEMPVKLVGVGEKMNDLRDFDPATFAAALFDEEE
ncbi:MAG: signal recognition particle-docking protein FtsY [Deltaproteobacteria bacterium]